MLVRRLRLATGLVLAVFVVLHFLNHAAGLVSLDAMEAFRKAVTKIWYNPAGGAVLGLSFLTHFLLALWSLYKRSHLRLKAWEAAQLCLGLMILPLAAAHMIGTRVRAELYGVDVTYPQVVTALWASPWPFIRQTLLLWIVWLHVVIGLHFWLRLKRWYPAALPYLYLGAGLLPILALLGFIRAGLTIAPLAETPGWTERLFAPFESPDAALNALYGSLEIIWLVVFAGLLILVLAARQIRHLIRSRYGSFHLLMPTGRRVVAPVGTTLLEAIRGAGIPHASVCGGRGRCTTCRVRVSDGLQALHVPNETEQRALRRIEAPDNVRLACQTRPRRNLSVTPLLPPTATAQAARQLGTVQGREQTVTVLFLDLRGSTAIAERLLPYDTVFVLNQFFAEMSAALRDTSGHYAQFNGDGLMALYGLQTGVEAGCREAMQAAAAMFRRLQALNATLETELGQALQMGVGIHTGDAIVGTMGPPGAPILSAVGDSVNVAARLEALTKTYGCSVVVSQVTADRGGVDLSDFPRHTAGLRGRSESLPIFAIDEAEALAVRLGDVV
ncbi:MAG: 2Fe-2S iron-sulfur cluster-binding protein [Alphaproteobacteria bacterium]|nr:2Fe-2S iron-sulfur cluster-binding protein [Alphaproteobacteria bacterium]